MEQLAIQSAATASCITSNDLVMPYPCPQLVVMLTRNDITVSNPMEILSAIDSPQLQHVGLKETGIPLNRFVDTLRSLKHMGKTVYVELMTEDFDEMAFLAKTAIENNADVLLGTRRSAELDKIIRDSGISCYPAFDDRTAYEDTLDGHIDAVEKALIDLCTDPHISGAFINPFRIPCDAGSLIRTAASCGKCAFVSGSINSVERLKTVANSGAHAFAVGTAIYNREFCHGDDRQQLTYIRSILNGTAN